MKKFTVTTDGRYRYYNNALEAILRFAEAKDECGIGATVYVASKLAARYIKSSGEEEYFIPQQEWFNL